MSDFLQFSLVMAGLLGLVALGYWLSPAACILLLLVGFLVLSLIRRIFGGNL